MAIRADRRRNDAVPRTLQFLRRFARVGGTQIPEPSFRVVAGGHEPMTVRAHGDACDGALVSSEHAPRSDCLFIKLPDDGRLVLTCCNDLIIIFRYKTH